MRKTMHFRARMSQRAINQSLLDLVLDYGSRDPSGKTVLNKKTLKALCQDLDQLKKTALSALNKGGLVVVEDGDTLIPTYRLDSFDGSRAKAS